MVEQDQGRPQRTELIRKLAVFHQSQFKENSLHHLVKSFKVAMLPKEQVFTGVDSEIDYFFPFYPTRFSFALLFFWSENKIVHKCHYFC